MIDGIEEVAVTEWAQGLAGITGAQMKRGLENWQGDWPPSLTEFRDACLGLKHGKNQYGLDYVPQHLRAPIRENARLLSSTERDAKREAVKGKIEEMRAAIRRETSSSHCPTPSRH